MERELLPALLRRYKRKLKWVGEMELICAALELIELSRLRYGCASAEKKGTPPQLPAAPSTHRLVSYHRARPREAEI
ncbi:hypothetical protein HPP92_016977 [Vanilla planifolia]|uniref:Uncharacterized protein n=1 Tax=Vanilla planifolia TaxID=51239 RepID=A0A835QFT0_VANPL|nr:hypothetical protein HPP92_016977 [Vanilla planifolia]